MPFRHEGNSPPITQIIKAQGGNKPAYRTVQFATRRILPPEKKKGAILAPKAGKGRLFHGIIEISMHASNDVRKGNSVRLRILGGCPGASRALRIVLRGIDHGRWKAVRTNLAFPRRLPQGARWITTQSKPNSAACQERARRLHWLAVSQMMSARLESNVKFPGAPAFLKNLELLPVRSD